MFQTPKVVNDVLAEYQDSKGHYEDPRSAHEAYGVLLEEVDELWDHVKVKQMKRDVAAMRKEAVQVAAMAMRFIDFCDGPTKGQR